MADHNFNPFVAKKYGLTCAAIINTIIFWIRTNAARGDHFHDERFWCYGTPEYFTKFFLYLTPKQIRYALNKLIKSGALLKSNYNKKAYDRTLWYAPSDDLLMELNLDRTCLNPATTLTGGHLTNSSNPFDKVVTPIPDNKTQLIKNNKTLSDFEKSPNYKDDKLFMIFYSKYPKKEKPTAARKAFYRLNPTIELVETMCADISLRMENNWKGRHKSKIPHPATYLNSQEWEGEIISPELMESSKNRNKPKGDYDHTSTDWINSIDEDIF